MPPNSDGALNICNDSCNRETGVSEKEDRGLAAQSGACTLVLAGVRNVQGMWGVARWGRVSASIPPLATNG